MELKGNLDSKSLQEIFTTLVRNKQIGTLIVSDGESTKYIYFARAGVRLLSSGSRKNIRLGDLLVKLSKITPDQLQAVLARQEETGEMVGKILTDWGLVTEEEIDEAVGSQIEEEIFDLFTWSNASFKFSEGPPPRELFDPNQRATRLTFDVNQLVQKASSYVDGLRKARDILPATDTVLALGEFTELEFYERDDSDPVKRIVKAIDGSMTIGQVIEAAGVQGVQAAEIIAELVRDKKVEKIERAQSAAHSGKELAEFVAQCERELQADPANRALRERLAQAYFDLGRMDKAVEHLSAVARAHLEKRRFEDALAVSKRIAEMSPNDIENRERMMRVYFELRDANEVLSAANLLADLYKGAGDMDRVKNMYKLVLEIVPEDIEIRKKLINIYLDSNDKEAAAEEYEAIAGLLEAKGVTAGLNEIYQKILRLAPNRKDLLKKLRKTTEKPKVKIPRSRFYYVRKLLRIVVLLALLGGAAGAGFWEYKSRQEAGPLIMDAREMVETGRFDDADALLGELARKHQYTILRYTVLPDEIESVGKARAELRERKQREVTAALELSKMKWENLKAEDAKARERFGEGLVMRLKALETRVKEFAEEVPPNQYTEEAAQWLAARLKRVEEALAMLAAAEKAESEMLLAEGRRIRQQIMTDFRDTPAVENLQMPFMIDSVPQGVEIALGQEIIGRTPIMRYHGVYDYDKTLVFRLSKDGYYDEEVSLDSDAVLKKPVFPVTMRRRPLWILRTGEGIENAPVASGRRLYTGSRDGFLYAIDLDQMASKDGLKAPAWRFKNPNRVGLGGILSSPAVKGDLVVFPHTDSHIYAVRNGVEVWSYGIGAGNSFIGSPLFADQRVIVGFGAGRNGALVCLPLDQQAKTGPYWTFPDAGRIDRLAVPPVMDPKDPNTVYYHTTSGEIGALDVDSGRLVAKTALGSVASAPIAAQDDGLLFVVTHGGTLNCLDFTRIRKGGQPVARWKWEAGENVLAEPLVYSGWVVICTESGKVIALDARDVAGCTEQWRVETAGLIKAKPCVALNTLFVGSFDKSVYAFGFWKGKTSWVFKTDWQISGLTVHDSVVYATTVEGILFAVRTE